jgi:hypothetical protein
MDRNRNRNTDGLRQGHRRTGTRTQTDRDTDRQGQEHRWTGAGTQRDGESDTNKHGQGYDTDIDNFNGKLTKNKSVEALSFKYLTK